MTFSIGGKLAGGLFTATSVSATVAAPYVPKLIDKYVLASSSSKVESFSLDSSYSEEFEVVVSDESFVPQTVEAPEVQTENEPQQEEVIVSYNISTTASKLADVQLTENQQAYDRIKKWLGENSTCQISFMISTKDKSALDFSNIDREDMRDDAILRKDSSLKKSKLKSFADQLDSEDGLTAKYIQQLVKNCTSGKKLYLHWRDVVTENIGEFKDLKKVWIDYKTLKVGTVFKD